MLNFENASARSCFSVKSESAALATESFAPAIPSMDRAKKITNNEPLVLFGNGDTARDYTYIEDTTAGILAAIRYCMENENVYQTVNLGNSNPVTLTDLVYTIYSIMNKEKQLIYEPMQPGDVDITFADIKKAGLLFNYHPKTDIKTGLKKYADWLNLEQDKI